MTSRSSSRRSTSHNLCMKLHQEILSHFCRRAHRRKWPDALDWHETCAGSAERGIFSFLEARMSSFKLLLNGLFGVEKKNKNLDISEPVLHQCGSNQCPPGDVRRAGHDVGFLCVQRRGEFSGPVPQNGPILTGAENEPSSIWITELRKSLRPSTEPCSKA